MAEVETGTGSFLSARAPDARWRAATLWRCSDDRLEVAAVDRPRRPRDVARGRRAQEDDGVGDLLRLAEAADDRLGGLRFQRLLAAEPARGGGLVGQPARVRPQRRGDGPRGDRVDEHAAAP